MSLILDGTNGLSDVDGSASTPAIRGTDTNTGIFFPAADTIAFAEGGTEVMRIDSAGRVTQPLQTAFSVVGAGSGNLTAGTVIQFTAGGSSNLNFDVGSVWNSATDRFTAPIAGTYLFMCGIYVQNSSTAIQSIAPCVNGGQLSSGDTFMVFDGLTGNANTDNQVKGTFMLNLAANDYVDLRVRTSAPTIAYYAGHSWFQGRLIG
jgi:hypothetical protein